MTAATLVQRAGGWVAIKPVPVRSVLDPLAASIRSGVFEEMLLRPVIFQLLWRAFNVWVALGASALLFGAIHLFSPNASLFAVVCIAFEAGIPLGPLVTRPWRRRRPG